jgi:hypothetical protein
MFRTPAMNEIFSRIVTVAVLFHCFPSRSTETRIRWRYLSSCSSAVGTRFLHSPTTRFLACMEVDLSLSRCLCTLSFCAISVCCHFSSFCKARLSRRSNTVGRSSGGHVSQSSWYELLFENDGLRDNPRDPGGVEEPSAEYVGTEESDVTDSDLSLGVSWSPMMRSFCWNLEGEQGWTSSSVRLIWTVNQMDDS